MEPKYVIGKNIKQIREKKEIKQELLAKHLGISKGRMSQIESGNCEGLTISRLTKIADYLKTDLFSIVSAHIQNIHSSSNTGDIRHNVSADFIKAMADEIVSRMNK